MKETIAAQPADSIAAAAEGMAERPDSTDDLATVDVPALVLTSEGDTLITPDVSLSMADGIVGADRVTLEGVGHLSTSRPPRSFSKALRGLPGWGLGRSGRG